MLENQSKAQKTQMIA